jgi:hypothetical protein
MAGVFDVLYIINICSLCVFAALVLFFGTLRLMAGPGLKRAERECLPCKSVAGRLWLSLDAFGDRLMSFPAFQAVILALLVVLFVLIPIGVVFFSSVSPVQKYIDVIASLVVTRLVSDIWRVGREGELTASSRYIWRILPPIISSLILIFALLNNIMSLLPSQPGVHTGADAVFTQDNRDVLNAVFVTYLIVRRAIDDIIKRVEKGSSKAREE